MADSSIINQLYQRKMFRIAVGYLTAAWLLWQGVDITCPAFECSLESQRTIFWLLLGGLPVTLAVAWVNWKTAIIVGIAFMAGMGVSVMMSGSKDVPVEPIVDQTEQERLPNSVAVLLCDNLSADADDAYFAASIHEEILNQLVKIASLNVIARTSVLQYADAPLSIPQIADELNVESVLECSVRFAGTAIMVTAQLIDPKTNSHMWSDTYPGDLSDLSTVFAMQADIAMNIANALLATLTPREVARLNEVPTQNTRAYDFYLSGNEYARRTLDQSAIELPVQQYERAIMEDPEFAQAYAALSKEHANLYWLGYDRTESRRKMAEEALLAALDIAPDLPEVHLAKGYYHYWAYRDYETALREFDIAGRGMPGEAQLFVAQALVQRRIGQWEQSEATLNRAIELDPRNMAGLYTQSRTYMLLRDYDAINDVLERLLEITPDHANAYGRKVRIPLWRDGDTTLIKAAADNPPMPMGVRQHLLGWTAALYERDYEAALGYLDEWRTEPFSKYDAYIPQSALKGLTHQLAKNPAMAQTEYQKARVHIEAELDTAPDDPRLYTALGEVLAGLGEAEAAVTLALRAMELVPTSKDALDGPIHRLGAIRIFAAAGEPTTAIEELDKYLAAPGRWSIEGLLPDPRFDPIRDDPRFIALVEKYRRKE